ncbi:MAG TPA: hypothetical protein DEB06_00875 [Phycisphaerales bacterium]|nr:hypothetical protein [Phycisphaerales bacterium]
MQADQLRQTLAADPFRAFRIHFGSGRSVEVMNPGLVAVSESGRIALAFKPHEDGHFVIDVMLIESLEVLPPGSNGSGPRNGSGEKE